MKVEEFIEIKKVDEVQFMVFDSIRIAEYHRGAREECQAWIEKQENREWVTKNITKMTKYRKVGDNTYEKIDIHPDGVFHIMDDGRYLLPRFGKYMPDCNYICTRESMLVREVERAKVYQIEPGIYVKEAYALSPQEDKKIFISNMEIPEKKIDLSIFNLHGSGTCKKGNFWISKKSGKPVFEVCDDGKHYIVRSEWSRNSRIRIGNMPGMLYHHEAVSNGGGIGNIYWVVPVGWKHSVSIDEI